jgi:hypothetical protein
MIDRLKPEELAKLRAYSAARCQRLDLEQRRRLAANLYLLVVTVPDDSLHGRGEHAAARRARQITGDEQR